MTRVETIERLQFLVFVSAVTFFLVGSGWIIPLPEWIWGGFSTLYLSGAVLLLLTHNILSSLKIDDLSHFDDQRVYRSPGFICSYLLQVGILAYVSTSWMVVELMEWQIWVLVGILLGMANLFLPAIWRIQVIQARSRVRKGHILLSLRQEVQRKTEVLLSREVFPELERLRRGELVSEGGLEHSLETVLEKISGIEDILRYIILDKYLELLEEGESSPVVPRSLQVVTLGAVVMTAFLFAFLGQVF